MNLCYENGKFESLLAEGDKRNGDLGCGRVGGSRSIFTETKEISLLFIHFMIFSTL